MRQMFADPKVEAVSIATPNHWHALSAIWAMKAGKDVYGEKPACYNIYERMRMLQAQRDTNRIMQVGSYSNTEPGLHSGVQSSDYTVFGRIPAHRGRLMIATSRAGTNAVHGSAFYNVMNHPNFKNPNTTIGNKLYGAITSDNGARVMELALRIFF
jgi:hypothetical protein